VIVSQLLKNTSKESASNSRELATLEVHLPAIEQLKLPTFLIEAGPEEKNSRIGGTPLLPSDAAWPQWKGEPLSFLAQIDLSEVPSGADRLGLPESGMLSFFYNEDQETWGYNQYDGESWRVIYSDLPHSEYAIRETPEGVAHYAVYEKKAIQITEGFTYPDPYHSSITALNLNETQQDEYYDMYNSHPGSEPLHQLRGYTMPVQNSDMEVECQLVTNGVTVGTPPDGYIDPRRDQLLKSSDDWVLLFQLDTDDDTKMCWGDCGMLYFWIKKQDLAEKKFDAVWMIFQCY